MKYRLYYIHSLTCFFSHKIWHIRIILNNTVKHNCFTNRSCIKYNRFTKITILCFFYHLTDILYTIVHLLFHTLYILYLHIAYMIHVAYTVCIACIIRIPHIIYIACIIHIPYIIYHLHFLLIFVLSFLRLILCHIFRTKMH